MPIWCDWMGLPNAIRFIFILYDFHSGIIVLYYLARKFLLHIATCQSILLHLISFSTCAFVHYTAHTTTHTYMYIGIHRIYPLLLPTRFHFIFQLMFFEQCILFIFA